MLKRLLLGLMLALCFGIESQSAVAGVQLFTNNAVTTLAAPASNSATTLTVSSSSLFPSPTGGNWFIATLEHIVSGVVTVNEIVKVTNVSGATWTVVRGQEGTSAVAWLSGDTIALLPTAGGLAQFAQPGSVNGDCTVNSSFAIVCTKTNGVAFGGGATLKTAYGFLGGNPCVVSIGFGYASSNITSCTRVTAGTYTTVLAAGFTVIPICTAIGESSSSGVAEIVQTVTGSTTGGEVLTFSLTVSGSTLSLSDNYFYYSCIGI